MYILFSQNGLKLVCVPDYLSFNFRWFDNIVARIPDNQIIYKKYSNKLEDIIQPEDFYSNIIFDAVCMYGLTITIDNIAFYNIQKCDKELLQYLIKNWDVNSQAMLLVDFLKDNIDRIYDYATVKDIIE